MMSNKLIYMLLLAILYSCTNPELKQKKESLEDVSFPVRTIDPKDEDFSDLQFLKKIIERDSIRVMMLGEASHGDGSAFLAKSRLVKFLHKECGFDVLAFESGFYDCARAWEKARLSGKLIDEFRYAVFSLWSGTRQTYDLLEYMQLKLTCNDPLELSGFDSQITGISIQNCRNLYDDLKKINLGFLSQKEKNEFVKLSCLEADISSGLNKTYYTLLLDKICNTYDSLSTVDSSYQYWKNIVYGVRANYLNSIEPQGDYKINPERINRRDKQMGNNLVWLLNNKYKNRKVIVWAASFHNSRNISELTARSDSLAYINKVYKNTTTLGDMVYKSFGNKIYSIFFTSYSGNVRKIRLEDNERIDKPSEESIENLFEMAGNEYSFVDMRNPQNPEWLKQKFISRPLGHIELLGNWSRVTDGIFYIEEIEPSSY